MKLIIVIVLLVIGWSELRADEIETTYRANDVAVINAAFKNVDDAKQYAAAREIMPLLQKCAARDVCVFGSSPVHARLIEYIAGPISDGNKDWHVWRIAPQGYQFAIVQAEGGRHVQATRL